LTPSYNKRAKLLSQSQRFAHALLKQSDWATLAALLHTVSPTRHTYYSAALASAVALDTTAAE